MKKYTSFLSFLKDTPKNLLSIIAVWIMAGVGIYVATETRRDFDGGGYAGFLTAMVLIMIVAFLRVWMLYQKNKAESPFNSIASNVKEEKEGESYKNSNSNYNK